MGLLTTSAPGWKICVTVIGTIHELPLASYSAPIRVDPTRGIGRFTSAPNLYQVSLELLFSAPPDGRKTPPLIRIWGRNPVCACAEGANKAIALTARITASRDWCNLFLLITYSVKA